MSHTNSTSNYNLPQFVGTDKPAWLGDINPAMSAIDTAIKNASDSATTANTGTTANTTAIGTLANLTTTAKSDLVSAINEVDGDLSTTNTQVGLNTTAIGDLSTSVSGVQSSLNTFMQKFNLNDITNGTGNFADFTLAQNSDGSIFKFYGSLQIGGASAVTLTGITAVPGLSGKYGYDTGLVLNTAPSEAYMIKTCGLRMDNDTTNGKTFASQPSTFGIAVGTNGHVYVYIRDTQSNTGSSANYYSRWYVWPCLYFNTSFGDIPTPE